MAVNNITSRGAGVHEALVNDPAKGGPHLPQRGDVPTPGDRPGRGPDSARYPLIRLSSVGEQNSLDASWWFALSVVTDPAGYGGWQVKEERPCVRCSCNGVITLFLVDRGKR